MANSRIFDAVSFFALGLDQSGVPYALSGSDYSAVAAQSGKSENALACGLIFSKVSSR